MLRLHSSSWNASSLIDPSRIGSLGRHGLIVALFCAFTGVADAQSIAIGDYLPLTAGRTLQYSDVISGDSFSTTSASNGSSQGSRVFRVTSSTGDHVDWSNDAHGLRIHARRDKDLDMSLSPAVVLAAQTTRVGATYSSTPVYVYPETGNRLIWETRVLGFESVNTPAGSFSDALKIELTVRDVTLRTRFARLHLYLAKDVGIVKQMGEYFGVYFAQELTSR